MGPRRDVIGALARAARKYGLIFGLSSHRAEHYWFFDGSRQFPADVQDRRFEGLYGAAQPQETQPDREFLNDWRARTRELIEKYEPQIVYFDWWIKQPFYTPYVQQFAAYYYNDALHRQRGVVINLKKDAFLEGAAVFDAERGQLAGIRSLPWQTDSSVSTNSWCYIENQEYKTAGSIIGDLVDIVSKHGRVLLNIRPRGRHDS